jgi:hypothetical protein
MKNYKNIDLNLLLILGILVLFIFMAKSIISFVTTLFGPKNDPATQITNKQIIEANDIHISNLSSIKQPTKTYAEWQTIAQTIYNNTNLYQFGQSDEKNTVYQLCRVKNDLDLALLIKAYGLRSITKYGEVVINNQSLLPTMQYALDYDPEYKATVNSNWLRKGINTQL